MPRLSRPALALALLPLMAGPAMAQANPAGVVWGALSPGNDWTAQLIQSIFPVPGVAGATGGGAIGPEATVIGAMLGQLTGAVMVFMIASLCYGLIQQSVAAAETGRVLGNRTNAWLPVRLAFAGLMAFPVLGGFSTGHALVTQVGLWGIGLARSEYQTAIQAIGPDAVPIVQPIIPGSKKVVTGLMQAELCRALVNVSAGNPNLVPAPQPITGAAAGLDGYVTWSYSLARRQRGRRPRVRHGDDPHGGQRGGCRARHVGGRADHRHPRPAGRHPADCRERRPEPLAKPAGR